MSQFQTATTIYGADVVGTTTGTTAVVTLPNDFAVSQIQLISKNIAGLLVGPTFSVGTNASSYNNVASLVVVTALSAANNVLNITGSNPTSVLTGGSTIYINITTAALATTYNFQIILIGYPI